MYTFGFPYHLVFYHVMINQYASFWLITVIYNDHANYLNVYMFIVVIFSRLKNSIFLFFYVLNINLFSKYSKIYVNLFSILSSPQGVPSAHLPNGSSRASLHVSLWTGWLPSLQLLFLALFCFLPIYLILISAYLVHAIILKIQALETFKEQLLKDASVIK